MRKFTDKAYGIRQQERLVVNHNLADSCIEGSKQLIFGKHVRLAEQVHNG